MFSISERRLLTLLALSFCLLTLLHQARRSIPNLRKTEAFSPVFPHLAFQAVLASLSSGPQKRRFYPPQLVPGYVQTGSPQQVSSVQTYNITGKTSSQSAALSCLAGLDEQSQRRKKEGESLDSPRPHPPYSSKRTDTPHKLPPNSHNAASHPRSSSHNHNSRRCRHYRTR